MGKTVYVPHFNRDTVEFASREREKSKPGIKILLPFLKNVTEESDLENFQGLILAIMTSNYVIVSIKLCLDVRNDGYIIWLHHWRFRSN